MRISLLATIFGSTSAVSQECKVQDSLFTLVKKRGELPLLKATKCGSLIRKNDYSCGDDDSLSVIASKTKTW